LTSSPATSMITGRTRAVNNVHPTTTPPSSSPRRPNPPTPTPRRRDQRVPTSCLTAQKTPGHAPSGGLWPVTRASCAQRVPARWSICRTLGLAHDRLGSLAAPVTAATPVSILRDVRRPARKPGAGVIFAGAGRPEPFVCAGDAGGFLLYRLPEVAQESLNPVR
jgi:hypothetical protein